MFKSNYYHFLKRGWAAKALKPGGITCLPKKSIRFLIGKYFSPIHHYPYQLKAMIRGQSKKYVPSSVYKLPAKIPGGISVKVFLDTNIIIGGGNCPEHVELKRKANDGEICLYIGHEICSEQSKRSTDHYFGSCNAARNQKLFKILQETKKTQQKLEALEEDEWKFWDDCQLHYPQCTFSGLISAAGVSPPNFYWKKI